MELEELSIGGCRLPIWGETRNGVWDRDGGWEATELAIRLPPKSWIPLIPGIPTLPHLNSTSHRLIFTQAFCHSENTLGHPQSPQRPLAVEPVFGCRSPPATEIELSSARSAPRAWSSIQGFWVLWRSPAERA